MNSQIENQILDVTILRQSRDELVALHKELQDRVRTEWKTLPQGPELKTSFPTLWTEFEKLREEVAEKVASKKNPKKKRIESIAEEPLPVQLAKLREWIPTTQTATPISPEQSDSWKAQMFTIIEQLPSLDKMAALQDWMSEVLSELRKIETKLKTAEKKLANAIAGELPIVTNRKNQAKNPKERSKFEKELHDLNDESKKLKAATKQYQELRHSDLKAEVDLANALTENKDTHFFPFFIDAAAPL